MAKKHRVFSLSSRGLKHKLMVSVALMSVLPLLVSAYLISQYLLPRVGLKIDVVASLFISAVIAAIGFFVTKEVFDRILSVTSEVKMIAAGDMDYRLDIPGDDEVGDLGRALNALTRRIRNNMEELKAYGERTTEINLGIQKRVIVLSSLLQISSQISQSEKLDDILGLAVSKARLLANSDLAYLLLRQDNQDAFSMRTAEGQNADDLTDIKLAPADGAFYNMINANKAVAIDKQGLLPENLISSARGKLKVKNTLALPVCLRKRVVAVLGIGNARDNFSYAPEDAELLDIFAKQVAIALENDILMHNVKRLEVKDTLTGLYNKAFMQGRLQEEIKRAIVYRRPCAFAVIDIDNFKNYNQSFGSLQAESVIKRIAVLINESIGEVDRAGRIGDDEFAVILPEKNKRQAQEVAEEIRKKVESFYGGQEPKAKVTVSAGVSENPLDGVTAQELILRAEELLETAKQDGRNRVVIFKER